MSIILGWARLSKREMAEGQTLDQQVSRLRGYGCSEIIQELESGKKENRKTYKSVLERIKNNEIDVVVVTRIDRLARSMKALIDLSDVVKKSKVKLVALDDQIDLHSAQGEFIFHTMSSLAHMESRRLSERIVHGMDYRRKQGIHPPKRPFGYKSDKETGKTIFNTDPYLCLLDDSKCYSPYDLAQETIRTFFEVRTLRGTIKTLNDRFGIKTTQQKDGAFKRAGIFHWSFMGLSYWLKNPALVGTLVYLPNSDKEIIKPDAIPALITHEQHQEIIEILAENSKLGGWGLKSKKYPLSGLLFCPECNGRFYTNICSKNPKYNRYICKNAAVSACTNKKGIRMDKAESTIIDYLCTLAKWSEFIHNYLDSKEDNRIIELQNQLKGLEQLGANPALEQAKASIVSQIAAIKLGSAVAETKQQKLVAVLKLNFGDDKLILTFDDDQRGKVFKQLIDKVYVTDGTIKRIKDIKLHIT